MLEVKGGQVRLGFRAPKKIPVYREEIYRKMKREEAGSQDPATAVEGTHTGVAGTSNARSDWMVLANSR